MQGPAHQKSSRLSPAELLSEIGDKDISLEKALELFETIYMPFRNFAQETRVHYKTDIVQLIEFLASAGVKKAADVRLAHLEAFLASLEDEGLSGTSRRRKTATFKTFFGFLASYEVIATNPAQRLIPPKREEKAVRYLTPKEYKALMRACSHHPRDAAIVEIFLQTGIRLSELARLTIDDVTLPDRINRQTTGSILVTRKGRRQEVVDINYKACRAVKNWLVIRPDIDHPALFVTKFRKPMGKRSIQYAIGKYLEEAGIRNALVHTLRHTYGTMLMLNGAPLSAVQKRLGHKDIRTTAVYLHTSNELMKRIARDNVL